MAAIRVVIVEDDPMVIEINRSFVREVPGFEIIGEAKNGKQGLKIINDLDPDLILVDIFMPEMDGLEFIEKIRENREDADIIVISASDQPDHIQKCMRYGIIDYLIKPFKKERLAHSLKNYLKMKRSLEKQDKISQETIDSFVSPVSTPSQNSLPKGLNLITFNKVRTLLRTNQRYYTSDEVAAEIGVSRVTARRYLEYLSDIGEASINIEYGSVGRPLKKYRAKPASDGGSSS